MKNLQHLSDESLQLLSQSQLSGKELVDALTHIENCDDCRARVPARSVAETLRVIFGDDAPSVRESVRAESSPETSIEAAAPFWLSWGFRFAFGTAALLMLALGAWFLSTGGSQKGADDIAQTRTPDNPIDLNGSQPANNTGVNVNSNANSVPDIVKDSPVKGPNDTVIEDSSKFEEPAGRPNRELVTTTNMSRPVIAANKAPTKTPVQQRLSPPRKIRQEDNLLTRFLRSTPAIILSLRPNANVVRGSDPNQTGEEKEFLIPYGEVVRSTKPVFNWSKTKEARIYKVSVFDETYQEVESANVTTNSHRAVNELRRGKTYLWKVTCEAGDKKISIPSEPKPPAMFRVASRQTVDKLEKLERENADEMKLVGFLLDQGLLGEAEEKLIDISNRNPNNSLIKKLLTKVRSLRGTGD